MAATAQEIERKYEAGPAVTLPGLSGVPGVAQEAGLPSEDLSAEYYDTDDLRLIRAGVTLRRRRGGHDAGWHLKLPAGADTRQEIRLPLGQAARQVPAELARLVRGYTRGAALGPVAQIGTIRQRRALLDGQGESLAEVMTDDVSAQSMGESTTLSRWREIEVELTGGGLDLLKAIDKRLRDAGLQPAGHSAKLARALAGRLPEAAPPPRLTPGSPAAQVVLAYAAAQLAQLQATHAQVRRDQPEAVHDMRVATRRLRSTLKTFRKVLAGAGAGTGGDSGAGAGPDLGAPDLEALRAELKWLGDVLGAARDDEVLEAVIQGRLAGLPAELLLGPVQARVTSHFAPRAASDRESVLEALDSARYLSLLDALTALVGMPLDGNGAGDRTAGAALPGAVRRAYRRLGRRAGRAAALPPGAARETALHETRKAAKEVRYAAECAGAALGKDAAKLARRAKKLQSVLGDQHDAIVARALTRDIAIRAHLAGESTFSLGIVHEACDRDAQALAAKAAAHCDRMLAGRGPAWLR
ncbi:MAG TPA: CYTH and CHAD domain-containing protein [Streptosporangiaceae bacterium]